MPSLESELSSRAGTQTLIIDKTLGPLLIVGLDVLADRQVVSNGDCDPDRERSVIDLVKVNNSPLSLLDRS